MDLISRWSKMTATEKQKALNQLKMNVKPNDVNVELEKFLEERRQHRERSKDFNVGEY